MSDMNIGGLVTYDIKVSGKSIDDKIQVHAIRVEQSINRISTAVITILDGDPASENFLVSASNTFIPGNEITIEAGYDSKNKILFSGVVTMQSIRANNTAGPMLDVECKDKSIKMTVGRKSSTYSKIKDSDVISKLIGNVGLSSDVANTSNQIPELVQYYTSDWDFILLRAEVNSMVVTTINGKVSVFNPAKDTSSVVTLIYGDNLYSINANLNSVSQFSQVKASSWDYKSQKIISADASNNLPGPGNISSKKLSEVIGLSSYDLQTSTAENNDELAAWAKAQMLKSELSKITGDVRMQGVTAVLPGNYITFKGLGPRFDGKHIVSSITHDISEGHWFANIDFGFSPGWFVQEHVVEAPPAAGLLPGVQGLFTATVKKINDDPDSEYRILVDVALFNDQSNGLWARLSNFYSTNGKGVFFLPEIGDEVIVGFLNQDPRYPVILGSVYSQKNKPYSEFTPNEKNSLKGIVSKSELRIMFNDEKKILTLMTPKKNTIILDDDNGQIEIKDQNSNSIVMSSSGIKIKSATDINIEASQDVNIKGNTGVNVQASAGDVNIKGLNINEEANIQYSANGKTTAEVKGGVGLTLKAAMVMIN